MSATETIRMTEASGIRFGVEGADLILDADREAAPRVLEAIRRHRAGIVALLTAADGDRTVEDWGRQVRRPRRHRQVRWRSDSGRCGSRRLRLLHR